MELIKKERIHLVGKKIDLNDKQEYYDTGFKVPDPEIDYFTATTQSFSKEQVFSYIDKIVEDNSRYDFKIVDKKGTLIGEAVLNDIDEISKSASFRIAIFNSKMCGKGIGNEAISLILLFAFSSICLHRVELEVLSVNQRAYSAYIKAGFVQEGVRRDAAYLEGQYHNFIVMSILEQDYNNHISP